MSAKIVECPRDAMQGLKEFIPTDVKISYLNSLLNCNFHTLDFGSFVSPKAIPQLADTAEVLEGLHMTNTKLLAIVANMRGAEVAIHYNEITYLGFPFSISETFQHRNTNTAQSDAFDLVKQMQELCTKYNKTLVVYISMGFGNPYGDAWNVDIVADWTNKMQALGITIISLADTVGAAQP
ncbi:MAG: hydroxymethylglutaryl-CoA lyase, partial [Bacteroidota bacterium]|nr:hydroxymethylglutaryl-CoA lyase [Bacteroidota bacterium]